MLDFISVLGMLSVIVLGFWVMKRLDRALLEQTNLVRAGSETVKKASVLVFLDDQGGHLIGEVEALLNALTQHGISYELTTNPGYQMSTTFGCVLALSDNDFDNVLLCHQAKRVKPEIRTIARCSRQVYREIFHEQGVDKVISGAVASTVINAALEIFKPQKA